MKRLTNTLTKKLLPFALAGLGLALLPNPASAQFMDFTVNEDVVPGTDASGFTFTADKMNGSYTERITFAADPTAGPTTFVATAYADFTAWLSNDGTVTVGLTRLAAVPGPNEQELGREYGLYALMTATGSISGGGLVGSTATVQLYIDPNLNTTKTIGATGSDAVTIGCDASLTYDFPVAGTARPCNDDILVLSSSNLINGFGSAFSAGGFFDFTFGDVGLTDFGKTFFPSLPLLNLTANVDGDLDLLTSTPVLPGAPFTFLVTGDVSNVFGIIPEPATLTLLGMGLAGARWASRRRKANVAA
jgi:hypothetical protein